MKTTTHKGSCHCGAVRYQVELELGGKATRCNCRICMKTNITGAMTKPDKFKLLAGEGATTEYGNAYASRFFCKICGVHCYGKGDIPEIGGPFVSINVQTLDDVDPGLLEIGHWDGRHDNWQAGTREKPWPIVA